MKKYAIFIITLFLFIPNIIQATEIKDATIIGKENITAGDPFTESILVSFDNLEKNYHQKLGILYLKYELIFDDNALSIISLESPDWDSIIYNENNHYYVLSIVNNDNHHKNNCLNSYLYCGDYRTTFEFLPTKTEYTELSINISNFEIGLLDMTESYDKYIYEDIIIKKSDINSSYSLIIDSQDSINLDEQPQSIITNITSNEIKDKIIEALNQEPIITSQLSNLLSDIKINDYEIEFDKYKNNYTVTIPETINTLDIKVTPEDETATYKIIGNENLKDNSQITVEVLSQDSQVNTYTINIKKKNFEALNSQLNTTSSKITITDLYKKCEPYIKYVAIVLGIIFAIIIIIKIISKIKDKKIEDMTNKF